MSKKVDLTYLDAVNLLENMKFNNPNLRLGQLLSNATHGSDLYYITDKDLLDALETFNNTLSTE